MLQQLSFFPEHPMTRLLNKEPRDDVLVGTAGEHGAAAYLMKHGYDVSFASAGRGYDFSVNLPDREIILVQVKSTSAKNHTISTSFQCGYHRSYTGVKEYQKGAYDIGCVFHLGVMAPLFSAGISKNVTWKIEQFKQPNAAIISFENAVKTVLQKRKEQSDES